MSDAAPNGRQARPNCAFRGAVTICREDLSLRVGPWRYALTGAITTNTSRPSTRDLEDLRYSCEPRYGFGAQFSHGAAAMHLDGHFADRQLVRNVLVHESGSDKRHHLPFARRKQGIPLSQLANLRDLLPPALVDLNRCSHRVKQVLVPHGLREEVDRASLHALHGHGDIAKAGYQNDRQSDVETRQMGL